MDSFETNAGHVYHLRHWQNVQGDCNYLNTVRVLMSFTEDQEKQIILFTAGDLLHFYPFPEIKEEIDVLQFRSAPVSHDFSQMTHPSLLVLAFADCDIVVLDPIHSRGKVISRHNRKGCISKSPIQSVRWVAQSHSEFLVAHADGSMFVHDYRFPGERKIQFNDDAVVTFQVEDHVNPIAAWKISESRIHDVRFSPNGKRLATVGRDGYVRVFEYHHGRQLFARKVIGSALCVAWSPDERYLLVGTQQDAAILFSIETGETVMRCNSHQSWVVAVAFKTTPGSYDFATAGEDGKLCLWKYSTERKSRPVSCARVHDKPISALTLLQNRIITADTGGTVKVWEQDDAKNLTGATTPIH